MPENFIITASELGDYLYCKRGWWLRINNLLEVTPHMKKGSQAHSSLAQSLGNFDRLKTIATYLILFIMILVAGYLAYLVLFKTA